MKKRRNRRTFTTEQKHKLVDRLNSGEPASSIAKGANVNVTQLYKWRKAMDDSTSYSVDAVVEAGENMRASIASSKAEDNVDSARYVEPTKPVFMVNFCPNCGTDFAMLFHHKAGDADNYRPSYCPDCGVNLQKVDIY